MTIITFQNQDCKVYKQVPMTKDMLVKDLFRNIMSSSLKSVVYDRLISQMKSNLRYKSCQTKYAMTGVIVSETTRHWNQPNNTPKYAMAMSHLKKLGMILDHKGHIYLNPLVETRTSAKFYELVIEYYNLLWPEEFRASVYMKYKDFRFTLGSSEDVKQLIAEDQKELLQRDEDLQHLTTQQLYDLAFTHSKNHLATPELLEDWAVPEAHLLITLKSKMAKTYTNLGHSCMKAIAAAHFDILCEQLPIQRLDNNEVAFGRLPKTWKCIHFSETSIYKEALELYNLSNKQQPDTQQQFEEEDFTSQTTASQPQHELFDYPLECLPEFVWYDNEEHKQLLYKLWLHNNCHRSYHPHFSQELHLLFKRMYTAEQRSNSEFQPQVVQAT